MNNLVLFQRRADLWLQLFYHMLFTKWVEKNEEFRFIPVSGWDDVKTHNLSSAVYQKTDRVYVIGMQHNGGELTLMTHGVKDIRFITMDRLSDEAIKHLEQYRIHYLTINWERSFSGPSPEERKNMYDVTPAFYEDWYMMHWIMSVKHPENAFFKEIINAHPALASRTWGYYHDFQAARLLTEEINTHDNRNHS